MSSWHQVNELGMVTNPKALSNPDEKMNNS